MENYNSKEDENMSDLKVLEEIIKNSDQVFEFWKDANGWAPQNVAELLNVAKFDWLIDLTKCMEIWVKTNIFMNDGELLLARANLGSLVEGWLKLFYCVYFNDYVNDSKKKTGKNNELITPNNLKFEYLRQFSAGKLWDKNSEWDKWVLSIQQKRNAIHSFNDREIGTTAEFIIDVRKYLQFINNVDLKLPYPD